MELMKGHEYEEKRIIYPCLIQPKLNGIRLGFYDGCLWSYDQKIWNDNVLAHLLGPLRRIEKTMRKLGATALDGELYVHGWSLQRINSAVAVKRVNPTVDTPKVEFHLFDVIMPGEYSSRWRWLQFLKHRLDSPSFKTVPTLLCCSKTEADARYDRWTKFGYEGMMYRLPQRILRKGTEKETAYLHTRSRFLLKRKDWKDAEFRVVAITEGRETDRGSKYVGSTGALVCELKKGGARFNVGSGFSDAERAKFWKNPPIGKMLQVKFLNYSDTGVPLNPTAMRFREKWN